MNKSLIAFALIGITLLTGTALLLTHKNTVSSGDFSECVKLGTYFPDQPESEYRFSFYTVENVCDVNLQFEVVSELIFPPSIMETGCVSPSETIKTAAITYASIHVTGKQC